MVCPTRVLRSRSFSLVPLTGNGFSTNETAATGPSVPLHSNFGDEVSLLFQVARGVVETWKSYNHDSPSKYHGGRICLFTKTTPMEGRRYLP